MFSRLINVAKTRSHLTIEIADKVDSDLTLHLSRCLIFIDEAGVGTSKAGGVLVHCFQGKSRSAGTRALLVY
jgi:protein-tyrosine phosphatase